MKNISEKIAKQEEIDRNNFKDFINAHGKGYTFEEQGIGETYDVLLRKNDKKWVVEIKTRQMYKCDDFNESYIDWSKIEELFRHYYELKADGCYAVAFFPLSDKVVLWKLNEFEQFNVKERKLNKTTMKSRDEKTTKKVVCLPLVPDERTFVYSYKYDFYE